MVTGLDYIIAICLAASFIFGIAAAFEKVLWAQVLCGSCCLLFGTLLLWRFTMIAKGDRIWMPPAGTIGLLRASPLRRRHTSEEVMRQAPHHGTNPSNRFFAANGSNLPFCPVSIIVGDDVRRL